MDRFTRIYSIGLGLILVVALVYWGGSAWKPEVWELDEILTSDPKLAAYPYQFRVVAFADGVAILSTPRSSQIPAYRFLGIIHPNLANKADNDPAMIAAQQDLIDHQQRAMGLILGHPKVESVDWRLDTAWLASRGIMVPGTP